MKTIILVLICVGLGFVLGRVTAPEPDHTQVQGVSVDCYDSQGNLVRDNIDKYGAVITQCAPGQYARLHQPNPPEHIELTEQEKAAR